MTKRSALTLRFPTGGLVRRFGYQAQPPYTTPDCMNVRPAETLERRERGGRRPGLAKAYASNMGDGSSIQLLANVSIVEGTEQTSLLFGASNGSLFLLRLGDLVWLAGTLDTEADVALLTEAGEEIVIDDVSVNSSATRLHAAERGQKLYVADYGDVKAEGEDGTISSTNILTAGGIGDWTALSVETARDVVLVTPRGGSDVETAVYEITTVGATLTLDGTSTNGACSYIVVPGPKVFDPATEVSSSLIPTAGLMPYNCPLVCRYRDRIVFAGPEHLWYMSRQSDALDWNYGADVDDVGRAISGPNSDAGEIGDPIIAMISHSDDYLIFAAENSLWILRGDPAYGGQIDNLSEQVGIINSAAWCKLPDASILFLSRSGLFIIPPGAETYPIAFSPELLPDDLLNVDASSAISMSYDTEYDGVHLSIVPSSGQGEHWWIKLKGKSFWPFCYADDLQPTAYVLFAETLANARRVLCGCRDGYIRYFDDDADDDDGTAFTGYVLYGPLRAGRNGFERGVVTEITATLDRQSDSVDWLLRSANEAEGVVYAGLVVNDEGALVLNDASEAIATSDAASYERASGQWSAGRNRSSHPRVGSGAFGIKVSGTGRWAIETISLLVAPAGRQRI